MQTTIRRGISIATICVAFAFSRHALGANPQAHGGTIGLVLAQSQTAMHQTPDGKSECPAGLQYSNSEQWEAKYPTEAERQAALLASRGKSNYGEGGANVWIYPWLGKDPLPFRELQSKVAYGINLDGTADGRDTDRTCKHEKFDAPDPNAPTVSIDGLPSSSMVHDYKSLGEVSDASGIDDQLYRILGCATGYRQSGLVTDYLNRQMFNENYGRILIEVTNVDDELNDDSVDVMIAKGKDGLIMDANQKLVPWTTQRIDEKLPRYTIHTKGKIVNGVLITEPVDLTLPVVRISAPGDDYFKDMRLRLKLSDVGANGLMAAYHDVDRYWNSFSATSAFTPEHVHMSAPSTYEALHRLADGNKDPKTGKCTSISGVYEMHFLRAFIVHPVPGVSASSSAATGPGTKPIRVSTAP
jgi:hypothetical protein